MSQGDSIYFSARRSYNKAMRIETLKESLSGITEPRRTAYGNIRHKLEDIIS